MYIFCMSAGLFLRQFNLEGYVTGRTGKSEVCAVLTSCYKTCQLEHGILSPIMKELVQKLEKHQSDPWAHLYTHTHTHSTDSLT